MTRTVCHAGPNCATQAHRIEPNRTQTVKTRILVALIAAVLAASCIHKSNLDRIENARTLDAEEVELDTANLEDRVNDLFTVLTNNKITTFNTKDKLRPYFRSEQDLVDFVAIYAAEFREMYIKKERLTRFNIREIRIEENGVVGLVRIDLVGRFWAFFPSRLMEVQEWRKVGGEWFMVPPVEKNA